MQDATEYLGGLYTPNHSLPPPPWSSLRIPTSVDGDPNLRFQERYFREWEFSLGPGSYWMVCAAHRGDPTGIWHAALLELRPASSE